MEQYFATAGLLKSSVSEFLGLYSKHDGGEKQMVSYINKLLSTTKTRHRGLTILAESIPHLSADTFTEYSMTWVKCCMVQHAEDPLKEVKLGVLVKLMAHAGGHHDFDKTFVGDHLSKVLEMCLESTSNHNVMQTALQCLSACLNRYPNWFNPHTKKIESFLLKFLDHGSEDVVKHAAEAFHNLQQSGGGGLHKANYVSNFTTSFHKLCGNVGVLMNDLGTDFTEIDDSTGTVLFELMPIRKDADSIDNYYRISQRAINCIGFLKMMLKKPFSATKTIQPRILIDVIGNGMAMHVCVCQQDVKHDDWHRSEILKKVQVHLLYLLQMVLAWLNSNVFPFSHTISTMLVDSLLNCDKCRCFKANGLYYKALNRVFLQWIRIVKGIHPSFQARIFSHLCSTVAPVTNKVSLILDAKLTGSKSKKFKRKAIEEKVFNSGKESLQQLTRQEQTILENNTATALGTLKSILEVTARIKRDLLQRIYKTTIGIALDIQAGRCNVPYHNIHCQVELYKLLTAFLEQDDASNIISIHPITRILANGAKSSNQEISITCERGLRVLGKICQPVCPYITSTLRNDTQKNTHENININTDYREPLDTVNLVEYENEDEPAENGDIIDIVDEPPDTTKRYGDKTINILSIETIPPPVINNVLPEASNIIATVEIPMNVDDDEEEPIILVNTSQEPEDNDVEFVKEEVIISDDETHVECNNDWKDLQESKDVSVKSGDQIANEIIKTVNQVVTDEVRQVVDDQSEEVTKTEVDEEKMACDDGGDMLESFLVEKVDY